MLGLHLRRATGRGTYDRSRWGAPWGLDRLDQRSLPLSGTYSYSSSWGRRHGVHHRLGASPRCTPTSAAGSAAVSRRSRTGSAPATAAGHGTHVAGIVGGQTSGVANSVSLVAVRVLDCNGRDGWSPASGRDLYWVIAHHQAEASRRQPEEPGFALSGVRGRGPTGPTAAAAVLVIASTSSFAVRYASETRTYSLVTLEVAAGLWFVVRCC